MRRVFLTLTAAVFIAALTASAAGAATSPVTGKVIMLDAGHGGYDPGVINPRNGVAEKWINLAVVHRLKEKLEADGAKVLVTRIDDRYVGLGQRAAMANAAHPDIFVSIHHNSAGNSVTNGTEVYFTYAGSYGLADSLNSLLVRNMGTANRGVKQRGLAVTRLTNMPAVLTEGSFITSDVESSAFINLDRVEQESMGLQQGLINYFAHRR
jgi:N-acetylmuramoyl-L-alanine amidase